MPIWLRWLINLVVYVICPKCGSRCTQIELNIFVCSKCKTRIVREPTPTTRGKS